MIHTLVSLSLFLILGASASAQRDDGTSMRPIMLSTDRIVSALEEKNYEVVRIEMDIVAGAKETYRTLSDAWEYGAVAVADDRVEDLDIYVFKEVDGEWVEVTRDDTEDKIPAVTMKPSSTAAYKFVVSVPKYVEGFTAAHYALVIYHQ